MPLIRLARARSNARMCDVGLSDSVEVQESRRSHLRRRMPDSTILETSSEFITPPLLSRFRLRSCHWPRQRQDPGPVIWQLGTAIPWGICLSPNSPNNFKSLGSELPRSPPGYLFKMRASKTLVPRLRLRGVRPAWGCQNLGPSDLNVSMWGSVDPQLTSNTS